MSLHADAVKNTQMPIKKVSLFSSGVGFFEHNGELDGSVKISLPFQKSAMDDVLKSLSIYDEATTAPFVSYPSEETLKKTLESIRVNISGNPSIEQILVSLKGAEIEVYAPDKIKGKIIGTQTMTVAKDEVAFNKPFLSLLIDGKIQLIAMSEISSYSFTDPKISADLNRALEFVLNSHDSDIRDINIYLPSNKKRTVALSYVVPSPVWKATYRFDLSGKKTLLQGWAIIDNAGDTDWKDVELSLVVGRPVSFIQPLYAPYYVFRPTLPLSIAGLAQAQTYDSGFRVVRDYDKALQKKATINMAYEAYDANNEDMVMADMEESPAPVIAANYQSANVKSAGEQFVFTLKDKITLERQQSAMVPLVQSSLEARKVSIFSAAKAPVGQSVNPSLGIEIENNSGMKLPAGPVSIYDGGSYAGDALLEFLPQNEKRLISYGDDLSVTGVVSHLSSSYIDTVKISKGVMQINMKNVYTREYIFKNNANSVKNLILEHPFIANAKLTEPSKYSEKTGSLYRFDIPLGANKELKYIVKEEYPVSNSIVIANINYSELGAYTKGEFPKAVKDAFKELSVLANAVQDAKTELNNAETSLTSKKSEQERVRQNIYTVGADSTQGKEYLKRMTVLDNEIIALLDKVDTLEAKRQKAEKAYKDYIANLSI
jgi:hypothetical protein